ncbi:amino acid adenylation domain-containing protein [Nocardia xishanensis]|uniref:amino acid adenylation domain-containing protein n=1 Tax=Nocardia xishanensis TaxID=238964 RepID=UPI00343BCA49
MTQTPHRRSDYPLTVAQQEIWAYATLYGADHRYRIDGYVHLRGRIDAGLFERALRGVVTAAETLRVRLDTDGPEPRQVVDDCAEWPLRRGDFGDEPDPVAAALAYLRAAPPSFDLNVAPLFEHHLLDLGAAGHLWAIRAHHIVLDGGASLAFIRAVACAYTALLAGEPAPELVDTVAGYVEQDQRYRASRRFTDDRAFWSGRLAGLPDAPMFAHPPVATGASGPIRHSGRPRDEDWRDFLGAAARFGVDWPALLAATTALVLHADSGARTVVLGLPVPAKRSWRALGMTSNVVGLRVEVDPGASIGALAVATQAELGKVLRHQHYRRFDLLADGTSPGGEHRITGPMINILPIPPGIHFGDVIATLIPVSTGSTEAFGIGVYLGDGPPRIDMDTTADRCDAPALASLHRRLLTAMSEVAAAAADTPAGRLTPAPAVAASRSPHEDPTGATDRGIAEVFRSVARRYPERHALWYEGEHVSYRELELRAERFAHHLAARHGVRLGTPVGVRLPRTPELVVATLALMRLGAICVPLHEQDPPDRVAWVLAHTGTELVLDDIALVRAVAESDGPVLTTPVNSVPADAAAWLMFTSGSTGAPKGVLATHRAMVTRAIDRIAAGTEYARMLMHSPYAWDMVVWELWMPLLQGHTAVIATPDRLGAEDFRHVLRAGEVTAMLLAAGLFQVLVDDIPESLAQLRTLSSAGDILAPDTVRAMRAAAPGISIVNIYGPVEATAYATAYSIPAGPLPDEAIPVGRAVDHTEVLVLDALLRPMPPGMVGEIYLTGAGLARGYHRMPGRTATVFIANPFGAPGSRMYRTGDHGSWGADGTVRFLGRGDRQVKVNGIRVEPGEIEHAIRSMPGVTAAVVTAHRMAAGKTLVAHVVAAEPIDTAVMRSRLARVLPAYLLPAVIVQIPALPLTVNGKVDRAALTMPASAAADPPRTPRQQILAGLFADAIGQQRVGVEDDFFRVGGNSLAAIRLAASASRTFGVVVSLRDLLDAPTVAALERRIADRVGDPTAIGGEPVGIACRESDGNASLSDDAIPLAPSQQRLWTVNYLSEGAADYLMPAAVDLIGPLDAAAVRSAVGDVVRRHEILRTTLPFTAAGPVQRIAAFDPDAVDYREIVDAVDLSRSLEQETARGFRLLTETPLRVRLYRLTPDHHVLLVVLHHCAGDAESLALLLRELEFAYLARAEGATPSWPTPPVQFADYARWLHDRGGEPDRARYWRDTLAGLEYTPPLAVDHPRSAAGGYPSALLPFSLDAATHAGLRDTARRCGATTYAVLHAALVHALTDLGARPDLVIGTALSGRDRPELDTMLGCAADIVLIRTDRSAAATARQLIGQIRDRVLEAHENKRYPFERSIAAHTGQDRPLPQIVTTFFRDIPVAGSAGDIEVRLRELPVQRAEFEMLIQLREATGLGGEPNGIHGEIRYAAPLWDPATITALVHGLRSAITALHTDLDADPGDTTFRPGRALRGVVTG